jgi:hypothetical protein
LFAVLGGIEAIWLLLVVAFLVEVGEVFVDSSLQAVIPQLVEEANLDTANARLGTAELVGNELGGPPLGGFLFGIGHAVPFIGDAISFGLSGVLLGTVRGDFRSRSEGEPIHSAWADVKEGMSWLFHHDVLRAIAISIAFPNLGFGALGGIYVLFAKQILHVGALGYGLIISAGAVGRLLGTLTANQIIARPREIAHPRTGAGRVGLGSDRVDEQCDRRWGPCLGRWGHDRGAQRCRPELTADPDAESPAGAGRQRIPGDRLRRIEQARVRMAPRGTVTNLDPDV